MVRAQLDKNPEHVSAMFDQVAEGYDKTRAMLWLGQMTRWGRATARVLDLMPGQKVLDVACGTGTSSLTLSQSGAHVIGCDFSPGMLAVARRRAPSLDFALGDALNLPFDTGTFDAVTISFGLRNVADRHRALAEMHRVTTTGGMLAVCEFSRPPARFTQALWTAYLRWVVPAIARRVSTNPEAYFYLRDSIAAWPGQHELATALKQAGWSNVSWRNLSGGMVALHSGVKKEGNEGNVRATR